MQIDCEKDNDKTNHLQKNVMQSKESSVTPVENCDYQTMDSNEYVSSIRSNKSTVMSTTEINLERIETKINDVEKTKTGNDLPKRNTSTNVNEDNIEGAQVNYHDDIGQVRPNTGIAPQDTSERKSGKEGEFVGMLSKLFVGIQKNDEEKPQLKKSEKGSQEPENLRPKWSRDRSVRDNAYINKLINDIKESSKVQENKPEVPRNQFIIDSNIMNSNKIKDDTANEPVIKENVSAKSEKLKERKFPTEKNKRSPEIKRRIQRRKTRVLNDFDADGTFDPRDCRVPLIEVTAPSTETFFESQDIDAEMSEEDEAFIEGVLKQLQEKKEKRRHQLWEEVELERQKQEDMKLKSHGNDNDDEDDGDLFKCLQEEMSAKRRENLYEVDNSEDDIDEELREAPFGNRIQYGSRSESGDSTIAEAADFDDLFSSVENTTYNHNYGYKDNKSQREEETSRDECEDNRHQLHVAENNQDKHTKTNIKCKLAQLGQSLSIDEIIRWLRGRPITNNSSSSNKRKIRKKNRVHSESNLNDLRRSHEKRESMIGWIRGPHHVMYAAMHRMK